MSSTDKERPSKDLINYLAVAIKTAQLHQLNNIAVIDTIKKLIFTANSLLSDGEIILELVGEFFQVNGSRVRYSMDYIFNYDFLVREFKERELGTIVFGDTLQEDDVKVLISAIISAGFSEEPYETLSESIKNTQNISIKKLRPIKYDASELDRKQIVKKTYFNAVSLAKNISKKLSTGEKIHLKRAKRVMETIANHIIEEESMLIGMTTIKDFDEYTYNHSVNVSILSIALGQRIGLPRKSLADLGLSALLHDIGKTEVRIEILNKKSNFSEEEWKEMRRHPVWGAQAIFRIKGIDTSSMSAFISSFEHHLNYDLSGYPKLKSSLKLSLFSRIIAIADQYDAMTSSRVYSRTPIPPDKTLSIMVERSGKQLDPYLLKIFMTMVGVYPLGSLVMLNTNELCLVFENNPNQDFPDRPRVYVIVDSNGRKTKKMVDLMEKDDGGNFRRNIVKTLDPNQYKINLAEYLL